MPKCGIVLAIGLALVGCDKPSSGHIRVSADNPFVDAPDSNTAEGWVRLLRASVTNLEARINYLEAAEAAFRLDTFDDKVALLSPGASGYDMMHTGTGPIAADLMSVAEYANGSRVAIDFANLTAAGLSDCRATFRWGSVAGNGSPIDSSAKVGTKRINKELAAGKWTRVDLVLESIPPSALGFVEISLFGSCTLRMPR